jgi:hypothetical protein
MIRRFWPVLFCLPLSAHVVSMSSGDLAVTGATARYELRMPLYEITHIQSPEKTLFEHFRIAGATLAAHECHPEPARDTYLCTAQYQFAAPVDHLDVDCTFASATVPNHVHMLRAQLGDGRRDQAAFDLSFTHATLRFRPPTAFETATEEALAGAARAWGGAVQVLFLAALVLASRSRRELAALAGMFLAGQLLAVLVVPHTSWQPAPRFVEAATALTIAYLAVEILLLPKAGSRWIVAGALGAFHGLYFHLFLQNADYGPLWFLPGAFLAELIAIAALALLFRYIGRLAMALRPVQVSASALLVYGMVWFFLRLRG